VSADRSGGCKAGTERSNLRLPMLTTWHCPHSPTARHCCNNRSISPASRPAAANPATRYCSGRMGQTDGRTQYRFIDPAPHTMRTVPIMGLDTKRLFCCSCFAHTLCCTVYSLRPSTSDNAVRRGGACIPREFHNRPITRVMEYNRGVRWQNMSTASHTHSLYCFFHTQHLT